jgi:tetratricopeptide (TPR) repeat protein
MTLREMLQAMLEGRIDTLRILADSLRVRDTSEDSERSSNIVHMYAAAETGRLRRYSEASEREARIASLRGARSAVLEGRVVGALTTFRMNGDASAARDALERALAETPLDSLSVTSRPYQLLAEAYSRLGDLQASRAMLDEYDRLMPDEQRGNDRSYRYMRAFNKVVSGDVDVGLAELVELASERQCFRRCNVNVGEVYVLAGRTDEAIAHLERAVNMPDGAPHFVAAGKTSIALETLGDLYVTAGDLDKAIEYLTRFVDWWKDADPELQPRVQAARDRIKELLARKSGEPSAVG